MFKFPHGVRLAGYVATTLLIPAAHTASAAESDLPVIAVNREIGLSALGNYTGTRTHFREHFSETYTPNGNFPGNTGITYTSGRNLHTSSNSWAPGFEANAQYMTDIGRLKHLYVAGTFNLSSGNESTRYNERYFSTTAVPSFYRDRYGQNRSGINTWGEIGKGFLLAHDRLLLTPTIQGGYYTNGVGSYTVNGHGYVGLALHADYALTDRLVLRARVDWAQSLNSHEYFTNAPGADRGGSRPIARGEIGLDYRATAHLHVTGGVRYTHIDFGTAHGHRSEQYPDYLGTTVWTDDARASAFQNGVNLRLGLAYGF